MTDERHASRLHYRRVSGHGCIHASAVRAASDRAIAGAGRSPAELRPYESPASAPRPAAGPPAGIDVEDVLVFGSLAVGRLRLVAWMFLTQPPASFSSCWSASVSRRSVQARAHARHVLAQIAQCR
jgi:hypothetical protein